MVELKDQTENQEMLGWRKADYTGLHFSAPEETSIRPSRIVPSMLQSQDRIRFLVRNPILDGGSYRFDRLPCQCPAAIAIPKDLRANGCAQTFANSPMHRQLAGHY